MLTCRVMRNVKKFGVCNARCYAFVTQCQISPIKSSFVGLRSNNQSASTTGKFVSMPSMQAGESWRSFFTALGLRQEVTAKTPTFGESISEGDVKFTCKIGDSFNADDPVMEIETDKTTVPVPAPVSGTITAILVADGDSVKPGQELFKMTSGAGVAAKQVGTAAPAAAPSAAAQAAAPSAAPPAAARTAPPAAKAPPKAVGAPVRAAPPATKAPAKVAPVRAAPPAAKEQAKEKPAADAKGGNELVGERKQIRVKMNPIRLQTVDNIRESKHVNAMLTTLNQIDMSTALEFYNEKKDRFKIKYAVPLTLRSMFAKAVSTAIELQPVLNAYIDGKEMVYRDYIDIALSVATSKGIILPVIRNVESKNLIDIETALYMIHRKAKKNAITVNELSGATFTISNTGVVGAVMGTPIMNLKQSAVFAMHAIHERPIAINGKIVIRPMMYVALTYDHRLIDGREAVLFLRKIKEGIEDESMLSKGLT